MCCSYGNALHLGSGCRVLQFASYSFDVSIVDIVDTLTHSACLCIPSEYNRVNNIVEVMNKMRVTWADLTPSFAGTFTAADVPTLQTLVLAGEEVQ
jgi:non-ribosomal peptide synthetase component F